MSDVIICSPLSFSQHSENISVFCFIVASQSFGFRISLRRKCSCVSIAVKPESVRGLWGVAQWIWNLETETVECMRFHSCLCITTENGGKPKDYNYDTGRWEEAHDYPTFALTPFGIASSGRHVCTIVHTANTKFILSNYKPAFLIRRALQSLTLTLFLFGGELI